MVAPKEPFDIRNYLDKLTPAKEKNRYICPVCDNDNLTINSGTGAYQCWNQCKVENIRNAISPPIAPGGTRTSPLRTVTAKKTITPQVKLPEGTIKLLRLENSDKLDFPRWEILEDVLDWDELDFAGSLQRSDFKYLKEQIKYNYSDTQWVVRTEVFDDGKLSKSFAYYHRDNEKTIAKKGDKTWLAYKLSEVIDLINQQPENLSCPVLILEGEKNVEIARKAGIAAISFDGSVRDADRGETFRLLAQTNREVIIVCLADNDDAGKKKASKCCAAAREKGLYSLSIEANKIYDNAPKEGKYALLEFPSGGDIEQLLGAMSPEEFVKQLETEIRSRVEYTESTTTDIDELEETVERLKLEAAYIAQEDCPFKSKLLKRKLAKDYGLGIKDVDELVAKVQHNSVLTTPSANKSQLHDVSDLFALGSEAINWLVPGLLPRGETVVLAGNPKSGKTLLANDLAYCVGTGEDSFLGEVVPQGKVLVIQTDETLRSTAHKFIKRGVREGDEGKFKFLVDWHIDQKAALEEALAEFKPDLVIVDSLKSISRGSKVSENSSEFADNIYTLKEIFYRHNASAILIHHTNKNKESTGIEKVRGSTAISGANWGIWLLETIAKPDPNTKKMKVNPDDPEREFTAICRDTAGATFNISLNAEDLSWEKVLDVGDGESDSKDNPSDAREQILQVLKDNELSTSEISARLQNSIPQSTLYRTLDKLVDRREINCRVSTTGKRVKLYSLLNFGSAIEVRAVEVVKEVNATESNYHVGDLVEVVTASGVWQGTVTQVDESDSRPYYVQGDGYGGWKRSSELRPVTR